MKKMIVFLFKLMFILLIFFGMFLFKYKSIINQPLNEQGNNKITIKATAKTFSGVISENQDMFKGKFIIKIYNKINNVSISVKKGIYEFPSDITLPEVIKALEQGKYNTSIVKVTIPEGFTLEQIAETLEDNNIISKSEFIRGCNEYTLPKYIVEDKNKRYALEGYLFPDTYFLEKGMDANKIIDIMIARFENIISQLEAENNIKIDYADYEEIVIKASIIEREVSKEEEKQTVSSVINNRINRNMKLQIDATVLYAMGMHKDKVYLSDLKYESPYNTYYITGLPIGPISNPGKDSLKAALLPSNTKYLYYMTKDGVNHKFFETYSEFLKYKNS